MSSVIQRLRSRRTDNDSDDADAPIVADTDAAPRKPRRGITGILQIIVLMALIGAAFLYSRERAAPPAGIGTPGGFQAPVATASLPLVATVIPSKVTSTISVEATGSINVRSYVSLTPEVTGRIVSIAPSLRSGGSFKAGDPLVTIDQRDFRLSLDQANAEVAAAQSQLLLQQAESDAAKSNYALLHPGAPVPTLVARVPQIAQARAQLQSAQARASAAALDLSRTRFSLPFDGKITDATAEAGQIVSKGQSFGQAFAFDAVEATVPIAQRELNRIIPAAGRRASVKANGITYPARVDRVSAELDERTRFARLFLTFDNPITIPPGTFVDTIIYGPERTDTFLLPDGAEQANGHVWRVKDGKLERFEPVVLSRTPQGLLVESFDPAQGVVVGSVPGGFPGLDVRTAPRNGLPAAQES